MAAMIQEFLTSMQGWLNRVVAIILMMLPKSPFFYLEQNETVTKYLSYFNYFVPVDFMISVTVPWLAAITIYYVYQAILRWSKLIE